MMIATAVGFVFHPSRLSSPMGRIRIAFSTLTVMGLLLAWASLANAQVPAPAPAPINPATVSAPTATSSPAAAPPAVSPAPADPIAIVPVDASATVSGALQVAEGKALIATSGTITAGARTTEVLLPHRGVLRVCASTSVHLSADASVPAGETPGLMMALDHGAVETSFATGKNADILLTPDFRILIGAAGSSQVKVRLGQHGDTCVDNPGGANAPFVVVSSVFEGGAYRVQPGQRVMFQHGSLNEVVDQEKEPCGCPPEPQPGTREFPLAQSAGLAPLEKPAPPLPTTSAAPQKPVPQLNEPLVYTAPAAPQAETPKPSAPPVTSAPPAPPSQPSAPPASKKKSGVFRSIGHFFRKIFGAD
jgi:hypothetical protein